MDVRLFSRHGVFAVAAVAAIALLTTVGASAQMRQAIANDVATKAGNELVQKIQGENCAQFASTMAQMKSNKAGATPSPMSAKLKGNTGARTTFVNIVAAPLLNKLIDCNLLPGGM